MRVSPALAYAALVLAALLIEAAVGYPDLLYRLIRHPVVWIGALIGVLDRTLNRETWPAVVRRIAGVVAVLLLLAVATLPAAWAEVVLFPSAIGFILLAVFASFLLAARSLHAYVRDVEAALAEGLDAGRAAVGCIVGRNPATLDEAGVARAAIESLAENFSDGVVAPAFWCGVLGLPGIVGYKAVNTADSMLGHRTPRHAAFGWASARLDDLLNLPCARLAALWLILAALVTPGASARGAWRAAWRDARRHRSPNAGWPEAAMAGALGLRLAGPRTYGTTRVEDAWMGDGRAEATADDIAHALRLYRRACVVQILVVALIVLLLAPPP